MMRKTLFTLALIPMALSSGLFAQDDLKETSFMSMVVPPHFIMKNSTEGVDHYESKNNRSKLLMTKEYKGAEDGFISAQSAADHTYQALTSDKNNMEVNVVTEKIGKMQFSVVSWVEKSERKLSRNFMRAYNDDGQFIHQFEMSTASSSKKQLDKAFRSFLKTCKPSS